MAMITWHDVGVRTGRHPGNVDGDFLNPLTAVPCSEPGYAGKACAYLEPFIPDRYRPARYPDTGTGGCTGGSFSNDNRNFSDQDEGSTVRIQKALARAERLNSVLRQQGIDVDLTDELVRSAGRVSDLIESERSGRMSTDNCLDSLSLGDTLSRLRHRYRRILIQEDLPAEVAQEALAVAQILDKASLMLGFY